MEPIEVIIGLFIFAYGYFFGYTRRQKDEYERGYFFGRADGIREQQEHQKKKQ